MTRGKRCSPTAPRQKRWKRVRVWQPVKEWAHERRVGRIPEAPVEVTDFALAQFLAQRGYFLRGVKEVVQSMYGPFGRERQQYLTFVFRDPRAFDRSPVQAAIREYQESWEGYEMVMRPKKRRRAKHDQARREPVRISDE